MSTSKNPVSTLSVDRTIQLVMGLIKALGDPTIKEVEAREWRGPLQKRFEYQEMEQNL